VLLGAALVIPQGLLNRLQGHPDPAAALFAARRKVVENTAMRAVMAEEHRLGYQPADVHRENLGYDIESAIPNSGRLRLLEVKGRVAGADTVTVSRNEIMAGRNQPDSYFLVVVEVIFDGEHAQGQSIHYIPMPFQSDPDFAATSVNYDWKDLLKTVR
jgi:hypothetical protein